MLIDPDRPCIHQKEKLEQKKTWDIEQLWKTLEEDHKRRKGKKKN